jgi:hypothetical protein
MDDRHAPKLYSKFLSGLLKKSQKIFVRGTSSVSSPSSSAADRTSQSPVLDAPDQAAANAAAAATTESIPIRGKTTTTVLGVREVDNVPESDIHMGMVPQVRSMTPEGTSYNMEGVQNSLPQAVWPYGFTDNPDGDTLASMEYFAGEQFWESGLVCGFSLLIYSVTDDFRL